MGSPKSCALHPYFHESMVFYVAKPAVVEKSLHQTQRLALLLTKNRRQNLRHKNAISCEISVS
jgi:hypothetical protein